MTDDLEPPDDPLEMIELPQRMRSMEGCDLDWNRNLVQLAVVCSGAVIGAIVGALYARPLLVFGALVGSVPGAIVGTFVGGAFVGHTSRSPDRIAKSELRRRVASLERQFRWWSQVFAIGALIGIGSLPFLASWNADWACPLAVIVINGVPALKGVTFAIGHQLQEYRRLLETHSRQAPK